MSKVFVMEQVDESGIRYRRAQPVNVIGVCEATEEAARAFAVKHFRRPERCSCEHVVFDLLDEEGRSIGWFLVASEWEVEGV